LILRGIKIIIIIISLSFSLFLFFFFVFLFFLFCFKRILVLEGFGRFWKVFISFFVHFIQSIFFCFLFIFFIFSFSSSFLIPFHLPLFCLFCISITKQLNSLNITPISFFFVLFLCFFFLPLPPANKIGPKQINFSYFHLQFYPSLAKFPIFFYLFIIM